MTKIYQPLIINDGAGQYFKLPILTTTERNNLTPVNGMEIYNSTTLKKETYQNGYWVSPVNQQSGTFSMSAVTITKNTTYTKTIALDATDYTRGRIEFYIPASIGGLYGRMHADINFTTAVNDAYARSSSLAYVAIYGYSVADWRANFYYYTDDASLSAAAIFQNSANGNNQLFSCIINGSNIELAIKNLSLVLDSVLTIKGFFNVTK